MAAAQFDQPAPHTHNLAGRKGIPTMLLAVDWFNWRLSQRLGHVCCNQSEVVCVLGVMANEV